MPLTQDSKYRCQWKHRGSNFMETSENFVEIDGKWL